MSDDNLDLQANTAIRFEHGGKVWWLSQLTLGDRAQLLRSAKEYWRTQFRDVLRALEGVPDDHKKTLVQEAYDDFLAGGMVFGNAKFLDYAFSPDGLAEWFWLSLRRRHPETTYEQAREMLVPENWLEAQRALVAQLTAGRSDDQNPANGAATSRPSATAESTGTGSFGA